MNFPSIDIQGSILSTDLLAKIRSEQATFQQGKDFNPDLTNAKLKDEISLAWQEAKGQWTIYKSKLTRLKEGETGTTETRNFWISPILTNLGYNLTFDRKGEELNGKSFPIGYRDSNLDNFPVYVGGYHESLDKRPENKQLRVSPHAMVQEYLNYSEHLYGMVTNGRQLRLLRDASRITRLSYVEFNLEKMMEEDLYSDFVILYRVLHASRFLKKVGGKAETIIEEYHQEGLEAGSTIRSELGKAVKGAIKNLANGFINHPNNAALREAVAAGNIDIDEYYRYQLRIIYRLLFLFVIEERNLVYADSKTPETKRFNHIYFNYYSLLRLRKLAKKLLPPEANRHYDLWQSLVSTFSLFEKKDIGEKLGIMSLQGDLFGYHAISNNQFDLHQCYLSNAVLLNIIKSLSYFENDNGVLIAVNYSGLDVEEFGSVYEGLLELKLDIKKIEGSALYSCSFDSSDERGKSGSHYTPEELVQPLIKHSLEYLIEDILLLYTRKKVSKENAIKALLKLKVCDVACGSGHILLSAARRIALAVARVLTDEEQPNPMSIRKAMKDVVRNCIYGVDKNPLAVELCKIALWLEAYNPGEPLNFLDHHIKCGDAIVGLAHRNELENGIADEAFKALSQEEKEYLVPVSFEKTTMISYASLLARQNKLERKIRTAKALQLKAEFEKGTENSVQEAIADYKTFNQLPETTPDEIERKAKAYKKFIDGRGFTFLKAMADTQCAQFFIPKTEANKDYLMTDADFRLILSGYKGWQDRKVAKATSVALEQRFFHWFIEFPEVFAKGGFDCILGNPPYLGGTKISTFNGDAFFNYCVTNFPYASGRCDLIGYFIRRIFDLQMNNSFHSIITTNTIAEGDTREGGFDYILKKGGVINFAMKNVKWPGKANVIITLYSLHKGEFNRSIYLAGNKVGFITSYLTEESYLTTPKKIKANEKKAFMGSSITGDGFQVSNSQIKKLIEASHEYEKIIYKYANGFDFNNIPDHISDKRIINFFNEDLEYIARKYPLALDIVEQFVKPEREKKSVEVSSAPWWKYWRIREDLYSSISNNSKILVLTRASSTHGFAFINTDNYVFSDALIVFNYDSYVEYSILQSNLHEDWSWRFSSKLKTDRRYSVTDCFETFPFPQNLTPTQEQALEKIGEQYHEHRKQLMLAMQLGLTKMYNAFHAKGVNSEWLGNTATVEVGEMKMVNARPDNFGGKLQMVNSKWQMPSGAKPDKQMELLYKHINKLDTNMDMIEAVQGIEELRALHVKMDHAVLDAYGWNDIQLLHNFYEVDYLPENDRVRFTIHPNARKEILKRLLELNHKIYNEEMHNGRHKKEDTIKYFKEKGIDMPAELQLIFNEVKKSKKKEIKRTDGSKVQKLF